jgi:uroporphyrinogen-III synthase
MCGSWDVCFSVALRDCRLAAIILAMIRQYRQVLLLTRPLAQSQRFAQAAAQRFPALGQIISPLLVPRFLPQDTPLPDSAAVIFTSETGVEAAMRLGAGIWGAGGQTAYCVGAQTAQAATAAGFHAIAAKADWRALASVIVQQHQSGQLLLLCAAEAPSLLQDDLRQHGKDVHRIDVYAQDPAKLSVSALAALNSDSHVIAPLFSPRSAQIFAAAAKGCSARVLVAAFSENVAAALQAAPFEAAMIEIADRPNSAAMLDAIAKLLERHGALPPNP